MVIKNSLILRRSNYFQFSTYSSLDEFLIFSKSEVENILTEIDSLLNKPKNTSIGKAVYTGPSCSLPRHKIKDYLEKNKSKKTSKISHADTILIDKTSLKELRSYINNYDYRNGSTKLISIIPKNNEIEKLLFSYYEYYVNNNSYATNHIGELKKIWNNIENIYFDLTHQYNQGSTTYQALENYVTNHPYVDIFYYSVYRNSKTTNLLDMLKYLINPNISVIFDEDILDIFNSDGIDLDEDYLNTLDNMFSSGQEDNIKLALEMLSNVNIEKFGLDLALLLNRHKDRFSWGSGITSNTGSFKTINKYFESKKISWRQDWRVFSSGLYKTYKDDERSVKLIEEFIRKNLNNHLKNMGSAVFEIENFVIKFKNV